MIVSAVAVGALVASLYTIHLCYAEGGATFRTWSLVGAPQGLYNGMAKAVSDTAQRTVPDPSKILVWFIGIGTAASGDPDTPDEVAPNAGYVNGWVDNRYPIAEAVERTGLPAPADIELLELLGNSARVNVGEDEE